MPSSSSSSSSSSSDVQIETIFPSEGFQRGVQRKHGGYISTLFIVILLRDDARDSHLADSLKKVYKNIPVTVSRDDNDQPFCVELF